MILSCGCTAKHQVLAINSDHQELLNKGYQQKVDNFLVILDGSSSMWDTYNGSKKFQQAKNILHGLNQGISSLQLNGGLHVIGNTSATRESSDNDSLIYGMTAYSSADLARAINTVEIHGLTPLSKPLIKSIETLQPSSGQIAVIVISDGLPVSADDISPAQAAARLKAAFGERICLYTILIGDASEGQKNMAAIAKAGECGFDTTESAINSTAGMDDFIAKVFYTRGAAPVSFALNVRFDFDKDSIRPEAQDNLDEVGSFLAAHPQISIIVEGHTCNMGSDKYNNELSQRRADSVKRYLMQKFAIEDARLIARGYGKSRPISSNTTAEGRIQNRRVMATINSNQ